MELAEIMRNRVRKELKALEEFQTVSANVYQQLENLSDDEVIQMDASDCADMCITLVNLKKKRA